MSRIKGTGIKRAIKELLKKYPGEFTKNFEENKKKVGMFVKQKKFRNSIAGSISTLTKKREKPKKSKNHDEQFE